jgi:hypothetical protein
VPSPLGNGGITPPFPDALAQKLKENCAAGDPVSGLILAKVVS